MLSTSFTEGIPITEVSRWLGHKSIELTHQIYGYLIPSSLDSARTNQIQRMVMARQLLK